MVLAATETTIAHFRSMKHFHSQIQVSPHSALKACYEYLLMEVLRDNQNSSSKLILDSIVI